MNTDPLSITLSNEAYAATTVSMKGFLVGASMKAAQLESKIEDLQKTLKQTLEILSMLEVKFTEIQKLCNPPSEK